MNGLRKFIVTVYFGTAVFVLCWYNHVTGAQVVETVGILAALYKAANVIDKKLGGNG